MSIMTTRTKIILLIIAVITAITTVFAAMYKPKRSNTIVRPVIKIAAELPLSGPENHLGLAAQQAIQNSLRQADTSAGYKYEVNYIDKSNLTTLPPETKAVLSLNIAPEPQVLLTLNDDVKTTFTVHTPYEEAAALLKESLNGKSIKNLGLLILAEGNYHQLAQILNQQLSEQYIVRGAVFQKEQTDFNSILNMLINNDTEYYVVIGSPQESDKLLQSMHDKGISNYRITALYTPDLTAQPELYNDMTYVGSEAGTYDGGLSAAAILALIDSYEKNFKKDLLPSTNLVAQTLQQNKAPNNIISIKANLKKITEGKVTKLKE